MLFQRAYKDALYNLNALSSLSLRASGIRHLSVGGRALGVGHLSAGGRALGVGHLGIGGRALGMVRQEFRRITPGVGMPDINNNRGSGKIPCQ